MTKERFDALLVAYGLQHCSMTTVFARCHDWLRLLDTVACIDGRNEHVEGELREIVGYVESKLDA
jgi:hypothetical protein